MAAAIEQAAVAAFLGVIPALDYLGAHPNDVTVLDAVIERAVANHNRIHSGEAS